MVKNAFEEIKKRTTLAKELSKLWRRERELSRKSLILVYKRLFEASDYFRYIRPDSKSKTLEREVSLAKLELESIHAERRMLITSFHKSANHVIHYDTILGKRWSKIPENISRAEFMNLTVFEKVEYKKRAKMSHEEKLKLQQKVMSHSMFTSFILSPFVILFWILIYREWWVNKYHDPYSQIIGPLDCWYDQADDNDKSVLQYRSWIVGKVDKKFESLKKQRKYELLEDELKVGDLVCMSRQYITTDTYKHNSLWENGINIVYDHRGPKSYQTHMLF